MYRMPGDYDTQDLVEMIALHLDASSGPCDTWKELASCFLKLSQCEGDRESVYGGGNDDHSEGYLDHSNKIPDLFTNGESGRAWRLRSRWWLNRHFHKRILISDVASGNRIYSRIYSLSLPSLLGCYFGANLNF